MKRLFTIGGVFGPDGLREDGAGPGGYEGPPTLSRMFAVAAGLSQWTSQESAWLAMHPQWIEHQLDWRAVIKQLRTGECSNHATDPELMYYL